MGTYLVKLIDHDGVVRSVVIGADTPMDAYSKAVDTLQRGGPIENLRFFEMEKGILTKAGWATFYSCTL